MKLTLLAITALLSMNSFAWEPGPDAKTVWDSIYTELSKDCVEISAATAEAPIDFYEAECKAFGGFQLKIEGSDLRYSPSLTFGDKEIDLNRPMSFHDVGSDKMEWMFQKTVDNEGVGKVVWKGLIYRLSVADPENPERGDASILYVTRLDGAKSCHLGKVRTNEEARTLVMNPKAICKNNDSM